jgi:hypothetical protein
MSQSREKINAFFDEFPFLAKIAKWWKISDVKVSRVSLELIDANHMESSTVLYIFDKDESLIAKTRGSLKRTLMSIDRSNIGYIVAVHRWSPSYFGYGFLDWILGNYNEGITIYKPPKDFDLMDLPYVLAQRAREAVRQEIDKA